MKKISILLVDDNSEWRDPMKTMLESNGLSVTTARDGSEGVEKAESVAPDLIVLDNKMPGMTGQEAAKKIRMNPQTKDIPIIMVSAMDMEQSMIEYIKLDVNDFLKKPVTSDILLQQIEKMTGIPVGRDEDLSLDTIKEPTIIVALKAEKSISRINFISGKDTTVIKVKDVREIIKHIEEDNPDLVIVNYVTAGLGTSAGLKLLYTSLMREIPVLLDMVDILKPESAKKLLEKDRRYYLLNPINNDLVEKKIKSILGKLELF